MARIRYFILSLAAVALLLSACATAPRQTETFLKAPRTISESAQAKDVPFLQQDTNYCGPASLAMTMNWAGHKVTVDQIAAQTYTPGKEGTLQADILGSTRRNGLLAVPVESIPSLLTELAAGHPVVVLQNLAFKWWPKWHYAVALGYDLKEVELTMHSGDDAFKKVDLRKFESSWSLSNYWGVVILPPGELAASANDLAHTTAAAALEQLGKNREAELIYESVLKRWPGSLSALIGMGNTRYAAADYKGAARYLSEAVAKHPESHVAWHNLATAQGEAATASGRGHQKLKKQARASAEEAIRRAPDPATAETYRQSLRKLLQ